jgi:peptidyl-tRNA hydrolase, PTH1 family
MLHLIVGLGNIGAEYDDTRHNTGFTVIDAIAGVIGNCQFINKCRGQLAKVQLQNHDLVLLKPSTYMNNSGISVGETVRFYKISQDKIIVIHDDIDLECGKIKMKTGGGHGGHNGLKSIDQHVGKDYWRIRIGVSKPTDRVDVSDYVLHKFGTEQQLLVDDIVKKIAENIAIFLEQGKDKFLLAMHK